MTVVSDGERAPPFSLILGGPFHRLLGRLRLLRPDGSARAWPLVAFAWLPLLGGAVLQLVLGHRPPAILSDLSVHVRLLVSIPVLMLGERILGDRCRLAIEELDRDRLVEPAALVRILARARQLRDSWRIEAAMLAISVLAGQVMLWRGSTGLVHGIHAVTELSFARLWYGGVALPLFLFLSWRWLWHWAIWSYVLVRVSRLPLATLVNHPDRAAGISLLAGPISGFGAFVFAFAALASAAWGTQVLEGHAHMTQFLPDFAALVAIALIVACGPLLAFVGPLYRARTRGLAEYHGLAIEHGRSFHDKWIVARPDEPVLGAPEISTLCDLGTVLERIEGMRLLPFGLRSLATVVAAAAIPMLPLIATQIPINELLKRLGSLMLGGLAG
ncbi:MAG: hypothetical protein ACTHU0_12880 [Kofleriaceae bacterium]